MDIENKLRESILRRPVGNGLAIIIANENSSDPGHQPLDGARRDLENMKETFEVLRFATLSILNASKEQVLAAVRAAAKFKKYPPSYKRIAFAFSGHGDKNVVYAHDGAIDTNQLYEPLQPLNAPHLADIPKLFFMDACRGPIEDVEVVARGKTEPFWDRTVVPPYGNYMYVLAFSTMPSMRAYEAKDIGGLWMNIVSRQLRTNRKSILDVLTEVNHELLKEFRSHGFEVRQQPVLESAINDTIGLLEEAEELDKQIEVQLSFPPYNEDQEIIDGRQVHPSSWLLPNSTHQLSSHTVHVTYSGRNVLAPVFMGTTLLEEQRSTQQHYQRPQWLSMCQTVPGSRPPTHAVTSQPHMVPTAHVAAIGVNSHLQMNQRADGMTTRGSSSNAGGAFGDSSPQLPVLQTSLSYGQPADSKPLGHYLETLNHYEHIGVIQNYDFYEKKCYTSQVSVILPNSPHPIVGNSHVTFPQKHLARVEAAKDAVQQLECLLSPLQSQRAQTSHGTVTSTLKAPGSPFTTTNTSVSVIPSTATQQSNVTDEGPPLVVADLIDVIDYLSHLKKEQTFRLALVLGLHAVPTLDKMRDTPNFLYDMLTAWLLGQDDVNKRGGHTWGALVKALRNPSVAQNEIAARIQREKCYSIS